jgi:hypothetical protein
MEGGELGVTARGETQVSMRQSGMPSAWCHGFRHVWVGEVTHKGYTFKSSPDDPLQFVVDRDRGYYYEKGAGTVTMPDGKAIVLP